MNQQEVLLSQFLRCEADLRALVGAVVRDVHVREDVFQEIALTLWQQFSRYDPSRPFGAWARGVAAKKLLERSSGDRRLPLVLSPDAILKLAEAADRSDSRLAPGFEASEHCLGKLPAGWLVAPTIPVSPTERMSEPSDRQRLEWLAEIESQAGRLAGIPND
jgi:RNA polymerase sigma-70 factor, ECF subfamily